MSSPSPYRLVACYALLLLFILGCGSDEAIESISFNDDVRPIFNAKCVGCHGGVKQAGGFGLVFRENALGPTSSGEFAIVPGDPAASGIIQRTRHASPQLRMPLDAPPLTEAEIVTLETWIDQGANWEQHWAYQPPVLPDVPSIGDPWVHNDIDRLVLTDLRELSLAPSEAAVPAVILRRVAFDLTGLPPSVSLSDQFLAGDLTYDQLVDSLLASPAYGEHYAAKWLDLARYADSRGMEKDRPRSIWQYRDWVIDAFNIDMPFDTFTILQLAGDLIENPTERELIATGFHRNTMSNDEGGTDNEEFRVVSVLDRVNTTWEVWQGTTMACVQCHSHPYDPIKHEEYYTSYALWNNTTDRDHSNESPVLRTLYEEEEQEYKRLTEWIAQHAEEETDERIHDWFAAIKLREPRYRPEDFMNVQGGVYTGRAEEEYLALKGGESFALPHHNYTGVGGIQLNLRSMAAGRLLVRRDAPDGPVIGRLVATGESWDHEERIVLDPLEGEHVLYFTVEGSADADVFGIMNVGVEPQLPGHKQEGVARIEAYIQNLATCEEAVTTPVMLEVPDQQRRDNYMFDRGNWLVRGKEVSGGVPALLNGGAAVEIDNRLAFARWLMNPDQPLTARVAVNRLWAYLFGSGLISTVEDLGSQGARNHHPELLDYLAVHYATDLGWSQKELLRLIVTSATYRQSSEVSAEMLDTDPYNDQLARGPRRRLTAEEVRDQALAVSGLLSAKMYGPGVMPPQPEGLWDNIPYSGARWETSTGEDRYRRAVYTFLRRSVGHPMLATFDGPNREFCLSRRIPTNTPLQALMTMNDPAYIEVASVLARQVSDLPSPADRIAEIFERLLLRPIAPEELSAFRQLYEEASKQYALQRTEPEPHAALTVVANAILNLDEFITLG